MDLFKHAREQIAKARANRATGAESVKLLKASCREAHETAGWLMSGVEIGEVLRRLRLRERRGPVGEGRPGEGNG